MQIKDETSNLEFEGVKLHMNLKFIFGEQKSLYRCSKIESFFF